MAVIEHRSIDGVMNAYEYFEKPNFSVHQGRDQRAYYDGGQMDEGANKLNEWLQMIQQSGTGAIYTLKVYPEDTTNITSKTPHSGSTTFMLSENRAVVKDPATGMFLIDRTVKPEGANTSVMARLDALEKTNQELRDKLHEEQMRSLETKFQNQIAGIQTAYQEKPDMSERFMLLLEDKPDRFDKVVDTIGHMVGQLAGLFQGKKDFITNRVPANNIQGTEKTTVMRDQQNGEQPEHGGQEDDTEQIPVTHEGAYDHGHLTAEQKNLKASHQYPILKEAIERLTDEQREDEQMICLEVLEARIGSVTLTHMLIKCASLDNEDLNKLLNNLQ